MVGPVALNPELSVSLRLLLHWLGGAWSPPDEPIMTQRFAPLGFPLLAMLRSPSRRCILSVGSDCPASRFHGLTSSWHCLV